MAEITIWQRMRPRLAPVPVGFKFADPAILVSTWFGSGLLRPAPGTVGSLAALPFGYVIGTYLGIWGLIAAIVLAFAGGIYAVHQLEKQPGADHDSPSVVIDEVIGVWIAGIPAAFYPQLWIPAFFLFRFFDVLKPWPISFLDRKVSGAFGVIIDDMVAGVIAMLGVGAMAYGILLR